MDATQTPRREQAARVPEVAFRGLLRDLGGVLVSEGDRLGPDPLPHVPIGGADEEGTGRLILPLTSLPSDFEGSGLRILLDLTQEPYPGFEGLCLPF